MAPLLLDQRSLIKFGFYFCLLLAIVFFGGYYSGYAKGYGHAESRSKQNELVQLTLDLPEPAYTESDVFEPRPPAEIEPGVDIDVDRPDEAIAEVITSGPGDAGVAETRVAAAAPGDGFRAVTPGQPVHLASLEVTPDVVAGTIPGVQSPEQQADEAAVAALASNASVTEARYSIQVGMYGSAGNAELLLEALSASSLDAYIDEFTNARNEPRFNVRFGYYHDRASAKAALQAYRSKLAGEGYVVRVND